MNRIKKKQDKSIQTSSFQSKKLSVAVCCKGILDILRIHLQALKKQSLATGLWELFFIFRGNFKENMDCRRLIKEFFPSSKILFLAQDQAIYKMRNLIFNSCNSPLIYFLDEDVILEKATHLQSVLELHKSRPELTVIGGAYLNHLDSSFFGQTYNWLVRLWMKRHQSSSHQDFVPAGNLSIKTNKSFSARFYSPHSFGAEEVYFLKSLHQEGFSSCWMKDLDTLHLSQHRFKDFIKRAWLQGKSLPKRDWFSKKNFYMFFSEPAPYLLKLTALLYLLLVRLSSMISKFVGQ